MTPLELHQLADEIWSIAKRHELDDSQVSGMIKSCASDLHAIASGRIKEHEKQMILNPGRKP